MKSYGRSNLIDQSAARFCTFRLAVVLLLSLTGTTLAAVDVSGFTNKMKITFSGYNRNELLTNFPVLVVFNTNIINFAYNKFSSANGYDLRFTDAGTNNWLNCEIESWDASTNSCVWVQVPQFAGNCHIWAYWGNASAASAPAYYTTNGSTWDSSFRSVWHLNMTNSADSTSNRNNGTSFNNTNAVGQIDGSQGFDSAASAYISMTYLPRPTNMTISAWIKLTDTSTERDIFSWQQDDLSGDMVEFRVRQTSGHVQYFESANDYGSMQNCEGSKSVANGTWRFITAVRSNDIVTVFVDGSQDGTPAAGFPNPTLGLNDIGRRPDGNNYFKGCIGEIVISSVPRSSNWIWACFMSQGSNPMFTVYGSVATQGQPAPTVDNAGGATDITATSATLNGNLTSTGAAPAYVYVFWGTNDGGRTFGLWGNTNSLGALDVSFISKSVTGLTPSATYYYRFYATSSAGDAWAYPASSFTLMTGGASAGMTYYVSPSGNDASNGLSPASAWQTLARVNAAMFQPGDTILLARGGMWREKLIASSSGNSGSPITYDAYGSGAKPVIKGSDILTDSSFQHYAGNVYSIPFNATLSRGGSLCGAVLVDNEFYADGTQPDGNNRQAFTNVADIAGRTSSWWYDGQNRILYINAGGSNPATDGRIYEVCNREDLVDIENDEKETDWVVVRNIVVDGSAYYNEGYGIRAQTCGNVTIEDCEAYRCGKHHFGVINCANFVGRRLYAAYAMPAQGNGGASAFVTYTDRNTTDASAWIDCTAEHMENIVVSGQQYCAFITHGSGTEGPGSVVITNITSRGASLSLDNVNNRAATIRVSGGLIEDALLSLSAANSVADGVTLTGSNAFIAVGSPPSGSDPGGHDITIQNCLIRGSMSTGGGHTAIEIDGSNAVIRFNTIVLDVDPADTGNSLLGGYGPNNLGLQVYGNIFMKPGLIFNNYSSPSDEIVLWDYNFYQTNPIFRLNGPGSEVSYATWQGYGNDTHSMTGDPKFVDSASTNYAPAKGSAAIDAAAVDSGKVPSTDILGVTRPQGANADMGAFEYVEAPSNAPHGTPIAWLQNEGLTNYASYAEAEDDDPDHDGARTWQEYIAGTDPTNSLSCFQIVAFTNDSNELKPTIVWQSVTNRIYSVFKSTNLLEGWPDVALETNLSGTNMFFDTNAPERSAFYRIKAQKP